MKKLFYLSLGFLIISGGLKAQPNSVSCTSLPSSVASSTTINVSVPYEASQTRDVVVEFWDSGWLGQGVASVSAGSGTAQVAIPLSSAPAAGSGYLFKTSIRPTGGNWTTNIHTCQKNNVTVTSGSSGQTPYGGSNRSIPGTIEAEHYDVGGEGVAYHDTSAGNSGGLVRSDDVDIEARDGGHSVGWTANGEWLEYTVDVTAGTYDLDVRVAATTSDKSLVVKLDGTTIGTINVPNTGGWGTFQTASLSGVNLSGGNDQVLRVEFAGGGTNLNWVRLASSTSATESVDCTSLPTSIASQTSYSVSVPYVANESRDVVVEFWDSGWIAQGTTTVSAGSGNAIVTVNLPSAPATGSGYSWKSSMRPVGADWTQNLDACTQGNVTVGGGASCDLPYTNNGVTIEAQTVNWSTGSIDISCAASVGISLTASGTGAMENADYLNIYYKVDGGANIAILEHVNSYPSQTLTIDNISGNAVEIIVQAYTSYSGEIYTVNNINVSDGPTTPEDVKILFVVGANGTVGFLEGWGNDQKASITDYSTANGNHGWGQFADILRNEGWVLEEQTEGPNGIDFANMDLTQYNMIVMGSNNANYSTQQIDAIESYVQGGGGVLFISDANFGSNWSDASNSDQQFLNRFGWTMNQDLGTYNIGSNQFIVPGHPVLQNVNSYDGEGVTPITLSNNNISGVTSTILAPSEGNVRRNNGNPGSSSTNNSNDATSIVATVGNGRISGHYDRNTFFNQNGAGTNIHRNSNRQYAINLFKWTMQLDGSGAKQIQSLAQEVLDNNQNAVSLYPNPLLNNDLTITLAEGQDSDVRIYNVMGQLVMEHHKVRDQLTIPRQKFAGKGMYFVHVRSENIDKRMKLIID